MFKKQMMFSCLFGCSSLFAGTMGSVAPVADFSGFYAGLGTGVLSVFTSDQFLTMRNNVRTGGDTNRYTDTAVMFSGNLGYGKMVKPNVYLGVKGSIYYTPAEPNTDNGFSTPAGTVLTVGNNTFTSNIRPIYNIDGVLGYEMIPHFLPFVEAGVTFGNVERNYIFKRSRTDVAANTIASYRSTINLDAYKTRYNVGLGMNYLASKNWMFTTEVVYNDLGTKSGSATVAVPGTTGIETQSRTLSNNALALFGTVSYLFNV